MILIYALSQLQSKVIFETSLFKDFSLVKTLQRDY